MPSPSDYLVMPELAEVSYDGSTHRIARFCGPGQSWQVFLVSKRGARTPAGGGTCMIGDILSHWNELGEFDRRKLQAIVRDLCPDDSYESQRLAEVIGSEASAKSHSGAKTARLARSV